MASSSGSRQVSALMDQDCLPAAEKLSVAWQLAVCRAGGHLHLRRQGHACVHVPLGMHAGG